MSSATGQRIGKYDVVAPMGSTPRVRVFRGTEPDTGCAVAF